MRERVIALEEAFWVSERRACRVVGFCRTSHRYQSHRKDDLALRMRIIKIAETRIRYGYRRVHVLLRREGWRVNHKRTYRIYCQEGHHMRRKRLHRHVSGSRRMLQPEVERPNACWSMDSVVDSLCDNRSELISRALDKWAYDHGVVMDFSRPGKPIDNATVESFNGSLRDECLNVNWFLSMEDVRERIEKWRLDYNEFRPHSSLGDLTPQQFVDKYKSSLRSQKTPFLAGSVFG